MVFFSTCGFESAPEHDKQRLCAGKEITQKQFQHDEQVGVATCRARTPGKTERHLQVASQSFLRAPIDPCVDWLSVSENIRSIFENAPLCTKRSHTHVSYSKTLHSDDYDLVLAIVHMNDLVLGWAPVQLRCNLTNVQSAVKYITPSLGRHSFSCSIMLVFV